MMDDYDDQIQRIRGIGPEVWPRHLTHPAHVSARVVLLDRVALLASQRNHHRFPHGVIRHDFL